MSRFLLICCPMQAGHEIHGHQSGRQQGGRLQRWVQVETGGPKGIQESETVLSGAAAERRAR